ncbi:MAG: HNH endonuclease, partial [Chitinophagaceae bacterium]
RLTLLYPIFHSYISIAKGEKIEFDDLIIKANNWLIQKSKNDFSSQPENDVKVDIKSVIERAEKNIKVMPGIRWQVFQRDNWKCVACGRSADDGIILHVDHILPRSKGGKDEIGYYQTLCFTCNIGKSNKDDTVIRKSRVKN